MRTARWVRRPWRTLSCSARVEAALGAPARRHSRRSVGAAAIELILAATNSATPIIKPEHLATDRPVLVCDVTGTVRTSPPTSSNFASAGHPGWDFAARCQQIPTFTFRLSSSPGETYACAAERSCSAFAGVAARLQAEAPSPRHKFARSSPSPTCTDSRLGSLNRSIGRKRLPRTRRRGASILATTTDLLDDPWCETRSSEG